MSLYSYQKEAHDLFLSGSYRFLAFDMGLGKTLTAISIMKTLGVQRAVIVAPASVCLAIEAELKKWWPSSPPVRRVGSKNFLIDRPGIFIVNYDKFSRGDDILNLFLRSGKKHPFDILVLDEAHALKGTSKRTKAIYGDDGLTSVCKRILPMSGTPVVNHPGDLYNHIRALAPELITDAAGRIMHRLTFEDKYCEIRQKMIGGIPRRVVVGAKNTEELRENILSKFIFRKTKREALPDLPPLSFTSVPIELMGGEELFNSYSDIITPGMSDDDIFDVLSNGDEHLMRLRAAIGLAKAPGAIRYLTEMLMDSDPDKKILVWCTHQKTIDVMTTGLAEFNAVKLDGRDSQKDREIAIDRFLNDPSVRVFCGNIAAGGTGLTLIGPNCDCSDVFFVESSFVPSDMVQSASRVHRVGQNRGVLARVLYAAGTFDDRIAAIIARKSQDIAEVVENGA